MKCKKEDLSCKWHDKHLFAGRYTQHPLILENAMTPFVTDSAAPLKFLHYCGTQVGQQGFYKMFKHPIAYAFNRFYYYSSMHIYAQKESALNLKKIQKKR